MFNLKLLELESELLAREQSARGFTALPPECAVLIQFIENEVGVKLGDKAEVGWKGWLSYKRSRDSLVICRGRGFAVGGIFGKTCAGLDVSYGADTVYDYEHGFDVTPPQELDHLLINFGNAEPVKVFLWYGENFAPYRLVFMADVLEEPHKDLDNAVVEACTWVLTRPKDKTLQQFLNEKEKS